MSIGEWSITTRFERSENRVCCTKKVPFTKTPSYHPFL
eukprot:05025.XXX_242727_242840_1 [CDS] Oithona nana genome sequencing.